MLNKTIKSCINLWFNPVFLTFLAIGLISVVYILFAVCGLDPDYGLHIASGQYILRHGLIRNDPFSYTMAGYPLVDHEWLTRVILFVLNNSLGKLGLAVTFTIMAVSSLVLATPKGLFRTSSGLLLLSATILLPFFGIRPQVISWLFFAILIRALRQGGWQKPPLWLPTFFLAWANLHGGFVIGLVVLALVTLTGSWQSKSFRAYPIVILTLSILATLINPYGVGLWTETLQVASDTKLRWTIEEWQPYLVFSGAFTIFTSLSLVLMVHYRKMIGLAAISVSIFILAAGLSSSRNMPFWVLFTLPLTLIGLAKLQREAIKNRKILSRLKTANKILLSLCFLVVLVEMAYPLKFIQNSSEERNYPKTAVEFLKSQNTEGEIFAPYSWGGYLIWKLPGRQVFIDGRMPSWRWKAPPGRLDSAFDAYFAVTDEKTNSLPAFDQFNVQTVLWENREEKSIDLANWLTEQILPIIGVNIPKHPSTLDFVQKLNDLGWKEVYSDETAIILKKN